MLPLILAWGIEDTRRTLILMCYWYLACRKLDFCDCNF